MRALLITATLAITSLISMADSASAQITNRDYPIAVRSYMARPVLGTIWRGNATVPARIRDVQLPDTIRAGEVAVFSLQSNIESASLPLRAVWAFGDGEKTQGLVAQHTYERAGTYLLRVTIENPAGRVSRTIPIAVQAGRNDVFQ